MEYTLLENGLDFILDAINSLVIIDQDDPDDEVKKRLVKYILLHISSGIELIFKSILLHEHWTYVFADMNSANKTALQSGDFKSVDNETIIERLENLCDIKFDQSEKNDLRRLRKKRNKAEHFDFNEHVLSVESSIHRCISILIKIIVQNYNIDTFKNNENYLFSEIKVLIRKLTQHHNDAKLIAQKELDRSGSYDLVLICPECKERFLIIDDGVRCYFCGYEDSAEEAAENYVFNIIGVDEYGGVYPLCKCPECENETFVFDSDNQKTICFSCKFSCNPKRMKYCSSCSSLIYDSSETGISQCENCSKQDN